MNRHADFEKTWAILCSEEVAPICEMAVAAGEEMDTYVVGAADGSVEFRRIRDGGGYAYEVLGVEGRNPLARRDPAAFSPLSVELGDLFPARDRNHYPDAFESLSQIFDDPNAPDIGVVHSAAHNWEDRGGHRGEHGSIDVVQARAPMIFSGPGFGRGGFVDAGMRNVDLAPTLAAVLGVEPRPGMHLDASDADGLFLARQDGCVVDSVLDPDTRPEHLVFFLMDGTNSNVLYQMLEDGLLPNIGALVASGIALRQGSTAAFPTITLANHTTMVTGAYPGHHGILHNAYWDRAKAQEIVTNHPATWAMARDWMRDDVETLWEAAARTWPDAFTACVNEPADRGAGYSTFDFFRRGEVPAIASPDSVPHANQRFVRPHKDYAWSVSVDHMAMEQARGIWTGTYRDTSYPAPKLMWVNFTLTDSAMHLGGPHSEVARASIEECDARIGEIVDAIRMRGVLDRTAFALSADHGMEETNPEVRGDWNESLRDAGIDYRDEAYGFIYLGV
ncbi:MAG: alkaline phosphatase family protein [Acidimicrobiia bacterium]|nr:alkaline phosphatase family protein [Acidimicrobiia bacterium]